MPPTADATDPTDPTDPTTAFILVGSVMSPVSTRPWPRRLSNEFTERRLLDWADPLLPEVSP